jgi:DNA-binding transcriptional ArsR family regulator
MTKKSTQNAGTLVADKSLADIRFRLLYIAAFRMAGKHDDNHALLAALKHPLRREILRVMVDRKPISPCELTERLDESLSNVSYHVRILAQHGVIKSAGEKKVRGATQHFYRWALKAKWALAVLKATEGEPPRDKP